MGLYSIDDSLSQSIDQFLAESLNFLSDASIPRQLSIEQSTGALLTSSQVSTDSHQSWKVQKYDRPLNVHLNIKSPALGTRYLVMGDYLYFHYGQDGFDDNGWGCAYRSF